MAMPDDTTSAARRVAEDARFNDLGAARAPARLYTDLRALLPILEAVAAGQDDEGRVERMARGLVAAEGLDPDYRITAEHGPLWTYSQGTARAAMALADAENAARVAEGWKAYEEARDDFERSCTEWGHERAGDDEKRAMAVDRTALDAAVRRIAGVADVALSR